MVTGRFVNRGGTATRPAKEFGLFRPAISISVKREEQITKEQEFYLEMEQKFIIFLNFTGMALPALATFIICGLSTGWKKPAHL